MKPSFSSFPFGSPMPSRSFSASSYRYGFNGQEKDNEVAGNGNVNTAEFWQYDTRLGRRWDLDPVDQLTISNYATFANTPIFCSDPDGDEVKPDKESAAKIDVGLQATLGKDNGLFAKDAPIGYNEEKGLLTYNKDYDKSKFNDKQNDLISRYATLIESTKDIVNVKVVGENEKVAELGNKSLNDLGDIGITVPYKVKDGAGQLTGTIANVYLSRNPQQQEGTDPFGAPILRNAPKYYGGLSAIHEIAGHAFLKATSPLLTRSDHNTQVEQFENSVRSFYKYNGAAIKGFGIKHN